MSVSKSSGQSAVVTQFHDVDAAISPTEMLAFLDTMERTENARSRRQLTYNCMQVVPGAQVADVGCGAGLAAREMAEAVGPTGRVWGFDLSETLIGEAGKRLGDHTNLRFQIADASSLPMPGASLDAVRAERVFIHLRRPEMVLAEAFRVLRPGGRLVVLDQEFDSAIFDGEVSVTRQITRAFTDSLVNGTIPRRMRSLMRQAGFVSTQQIAVPVLETDGTNYFFAAAAIARAAAGISLEAVQMWLDDQKARVSEDRFFWSVMHVISIGLRP